jgi:hypothetical protein
MFDASDDDTRGQIIADHRGRENPAPTAMLAMCALLPSAA